MFSNPLIKVEDRNKSKEIKEIFAILNTEKPLSKESEIAITKKLDDFSEEDINEVSKGNQTLLSKAASGNHLNLVKTLLNKKANPNIQGTVPLNIPSQKGYFEMVTTLLEAKANPNNLDKYNRNALFKACEKDKLNIIQLLIERKADVHCRDNTNQQSMLDWAVLNNQLDTMQILLHTGHINDFRFASSDIYYLDVLLRHYRTNPDNTRFKTKYSTDQLNKALSIVSFLLDKNIPYKDCFTLYNFLLLCDQRNELVSKSLKQLYESLRSIPNDCKDSLVMETKGFFYRHEAELYLYLEKLDIVLSYKSHPSDSIMSARDDTSLPLTVTDVEKLYEKIFIKQHPYNLWSLKEKTLAMVNNISAILIDDKLFFGGISSLSASFISIFYSVYNSDHYNSQWMEFLICQLNQIKENYFHYFHKSDAIIAAIKDQTYALSAVAEENQMLHNEICVKPIDNSSFFKSTAILLGALGSGLLAYGMFHKKNLSMPGEVELKEHKTTLQNK